MTDSAAKTDDYIVVARRYRPQTFDQLIGQGHVAQALKQAITTGRVGHAYLFTGARGVGKTSAARILAKALNCQQGTSATPCNDCDVCHSVSSGDDVDVLEIDGASNRGIDEIRQLRQNVAVRPSRSRFKVYIIDEVHMLTKEAFNALLKTLEEPPEHVKFIFATTEPNKIPITILSRCQRFDFAGIESTAIQQRLAQIAEAEGVQIDVAALQILAMRAAGSMRDSQSLLEQLLATSAGQISAQDVNELLGIASSERIAALAYQLAERNAAAALAELHAALADGADVGQLVDQLLGYFRDAMALGVGASADTALYALPTQVEQVAQLAQALGVPTLLATLQVLDETAARLRVSVHSRTLAEMAVVRICQLEELEDLATLVATLREGGSLPAGNAPRPAGRSPAERSTVPAKAPPQPSPPTPPPAAAIRPPAPAESPAPPAQTATDPDPAETPSQDTSPAPTSATTPATTSAPAPSESPAASPEPPPAGSVLDATQAKQVWANVAQQVGGILGTSASLATSVTQPGPGELLVRFDQALNRDACEQPAHKQQLESALEQSLGRRVRIEFETVAPPASAAPPPRRSRRQLQADAAQHPFVKTAMQLFDVPSEKLRYTPPPESK